MHNSPQGQHIKVILTDLNSLTVPYLRYITVNDACDRNKKNTRDVDATPSLGAYVTRFSLGIVGLKTVFQKMSRRNGHALEEQKTKVHLETWRES